MERKKLPGEFSYHERKYCVYFDPKTFWSDFLDLCLKKTLPKKTKEGHGNFQNMPPSVLVLEFLD